MSLREDITWEAVDVLRSAAANMPLAWDEGPWAGAANWINRRAEEFEKALIANARSSEDA